MRTQPASIKLNKTEFDSLEDWETYLTADYTCDKCNQIVSVSFNDLTKHQFSDRTSFNETDRFLFKQYEDLNQVAKTNSFLDFIVRPAKDPLGYTLKHGQAASNRKEDTPSSL